MSKKKFVKSIEVTSPCTEDWEQMQGNRKIRFCSHCSKDVNNISEMTRKEALRLIRSSNGKLCVRYIKDPVTNAPRFADRLHQISRRAPLLAAGAMSATLALSTAAYAQGGISPNKPPSSAQRLNQLVYVYPDQKPDAAAKDDSSEKLGSISGTILDPAGAVVPGRGGTLTNVKTKDARTATSNDEGLYQFEAVPDGIYKLKFEASGGFAEKEVKDIDVSGGGDVIQVVSLDVSPVVQFVTMGAVASTVTVEYENALSAAVEAGDINEVRNLIARGEKVNGKEEDGTTPLFMAVENGYVEIARLLIDFGAKVNARNKDRQTPLMMLNDDASRELAELLLRSGAKVNLVDNDGRTALISAARSAETEVIQALIDAGADVNIQDKSGQTALMNAANDEDMENVRALVLAGADVNLKNKDGDTAWDKTSDDEIEDFLVSHGALVEDEGESEDDLEDNQSAAAP